MVLLITVTIFGIAFVASNYFSDKKLEEIKSIQDKIAIDILSSETQFSLLEESSCKDIGSGTLSTELGALEEKLSSTAQERGVNDSEVQALKRYYSLLEIKDYLLLQQISKQCKAKPVYVLYFYSNQGDCADCGREGDVLTYLRGQYPSLRVYSFDYHLELSALQTLITLRKVKTPLPALIINNRAPVNGFKSLEDLRKLIPELKTLSTASSTQR